MFNRFKKEYKTRPQNKDSFIPHLKELVHATENHMMYYVDDNGFKIKNHGLFKRDDIAVLMCSMPEGASFPEHKHVVAEWLMIADGELEFSCNGETIIYKAGEVVKIEPGDKHTSRALTAVEVLAVTMPADEGFPDVKLSK
jgi:quercetin dioxygenase-like cupin family protein